MTVVISQKEFQPLVDKAIMRVREYFGERFLASYLHGSLNYGDAIPNISDMDCYTVWFAPGSGTNLTRPPRPLALSASTNSTDCS